MLNVPCVHFVSPSENVRQPRRIASMALGCAIAAFSTCGFAQITAGSGSGQQESRATESGAKASVAASAVHESHAPQSKDAAGKSRGATAGKGHKTEGAGGFSDGLYGTGAGSNK
ncbi:hypothetical protein B0G84_3209 [Paraburkholderia sp. BL8N3]|jgi:hypothetical protein|nr:beta-xylosidase [Paraburkholderia sp. BL8N3]TCK37911.1 hypothetical protein B0G84_3209 [Paraburkholderia sp. BL8N3]